jgi:triphosphoribosyl-dephospho-CoA synthase
MPERAARAAFLAACRLDVWVRKPGNVSFASPGHGMRAEQFIASSLAAAEPLFAQGARVGERIERACAASWAAAGCNTNLGIVLLAAPLAAAHESRGTQPLQLCVEAVLGALDVADAAAAFRAIAAMQPGGLGHVGAQDVHAAPSVTLRAAMALAAGRDSIARLYATGYAPLFDALRAVPSPQGFSLMATEPSMQGRAYVQRLYLHWLAHAPDSHIVRKHGPAVAHSVLGAAQRWRGLEAPEADPAFAAWDESLKAAGVNPGTSADLTVATLLAGALAGPA